MTDTATLRALLSEVPEKHDSVFPIRDPENTRVVRTARDGCASQLLLALRRGWRPDGCDDLNAVEQIISLVVFPLLGRSKSGWCFSIAWIL